MKTRVFVNFKISSHNSDKKETDESWDLIPYARHYKPRLIFFYPIFTSAAAYITDNLCTKNGNSSFFKPKIRGL